MCGPYGGLVMSFEISSFGALPRGSERPSIRCNLSWG